jgi:hypothetical protein
MVVAEATVTVPLALNSITPPLLPSQAEGTKSVPEFESVTLV